MRRLLKFKSILVLHTTMDFATFSIVCYFQRKEFMGQKSLSTEEAIVVTGESVAEILSTIWTRSVPMIKREVVMDNEEFAWSENPTPTLDDIGNFIILQDRVARKAYTIDQLTSTLLTRLRHKHINVMVHVYGKQLCSKTVHGHFVSKLLQPEQRDRANADSTQSLMALVEILKQKHKGVFAANVSVWQMWANAIQAAPPHLQNGVMDGSPPTHLIHMFVRASTSEKEIMESAQNGLQVADNINDAYVELLAKFREDFNKVRNDVDRAFDFVDARLTALEDLVKSNARLVKAMGSSITPQPSALSVEEERQIIDMEDIDHN